MLNLDNHKHYCFVKAGSLERFFLPLYEYIPPVIENPTSNSTSFFHSSPPPRNFFLPKPIFVASKMFFERSPLLPHVRRVDLVEHWEYEPPALAYLGKFLKAPPRRCVVRREDDDGSGRVVYSLEQTRRDLVPAAQPVVVAEDPDALFLERVVEVGSDGVARVFASEAEKDVPTVPGSSRS
jgi:hypothetical protein